MSFKKFSSAQDTPTTVKPDDKSKDAPAADQPTVQSHRKEVDRQAIERGEDEGMIVHPRSTSAHKIF